MRRPIETGKQGDYWWLTSNSSLSVLIERCPNIVLDQFVAITAFDSSPLKLTQDERNHGWSENDGVAWSPKVLTIDILPHEGWDEWYIFLSPALFKPAELFVNLGNFRLQDPDYLLKDLERTWDRTAVIFDIEKIRNIQKRFWSQIASINPETYLAHGDQLIFVTKDHEFFARAVTSLES